MTDLELKEILTDIKNEVSEIKQQLSALKKYKEQFPLEKLIEYEYLFKNYLMRFEQRFF